MRFAYADPPYLGLAKSFYGDLHPDAADYDLIETHLALFDRLLNDYPDGWAWSGNPKDLAWALQHLTTQGAEFRVCAWVKTFHQIRPKCSVQYAWEPVILCGGRKVSGRKPMIRDWLACARSMRKGLRGAKPQAFNDWVLDLLGFDAQTDILDDLFPGSGGMGETVERRRV
jgi:hypothetical protein